MAVLKQELMAALARIRILVERVLISFLKLPLEQSNAKGNAYSRFCCGSHNEIPNLRKRALKVKKND